MQERLYDKVRFYIKKPEKFRVSFCIVRDVIDVHNKRSTSVVYDERIDAVNHAYKNKFKDLTQCEIELKELIKTLYHKHKLDRFGSEISPFKEDNYKILQQYWASEYADRNLVDDESARNYLRRAIEVFENRSILTISKEDTEKLVNRKFKGNKQRAIVMRINQIFKFVGRKIRIRMAKKDRTKVRYLSQEELFQVLQQIKDTDLKNFYTLACATGCRIGELFALNENSLMKDTLYIHSQLDRKGNIRDTKTRRSRHAYFLPFGRESFNAFYSMEEDKITKLRNLNHAKIFKDACKKSFPATPGKWCHIHDLRHSYALWLLNKGISISLIAQSMGNSVSVCQEYYVGYSLNPDSIEAIRKIIG